MIKNANLPAMPTGQYGASIEKDTLGEYHHYCAGLSKREHFAGLAMQGLITLKGSDCMDSDITAKQCVRMADALLKALNATQSKDGAE